jgi:hypothetical protein
MKEVRGSVLCNKLWEPISPRVLVKKERRKGKRGKGRKESERGGVGG